MDHLILCLNKLGHGLDSGDRGNMNVAVNKPPDQVVVHQELCMRQHIGHGRTGINTCQPGRR